jgi:hypothetical protein
LAEPISSFALGAFGGYWFAATMSTETTSPHQKALRINREARWYRTFAEIGAGQLTGTARIGRPR